MILLFLRPDKAQFFKLEVKQIGSCGRLITEGGIFYANLVFPQLRREFEYGY
jgi:hypothetical protein